MSWFGMPQPFTSLDRLVENFKHESRLTSYNSRHLFSIWLKTGKTSISALVFSHKRLHDIRQRLVESSIGITSFRNSISENWILELTYFLRFLWYWLLTRKKNTAPAMEPICAYVTFYHKLIFIVRLTTNTVKSVFVLIIWRHVDIFDKEAAFAQTQASASSDAWSRCKARNHL